MEADLSSFVLRCSRSLKTRINVACNSDVGMQARRKERDPEKCHKEFCRYCMSRPLIRSTEMTEQSLQHNSCKDLPRVSSLISL